MAKRSMFVVGWYLKRVFVLAGDDSSSAPDDLCTFDAAQLDRASPELLLFMETTCQQRIHISQDIWFCVAAHLILFCSAGEDEFVCSLLKAIK